MQNIYTVGQVNAYIKNMFAQDFMLGRIYIKGEVSNCKYHTSGHIYFTLKDETGTIACVMFAGQRSGLAFSMKEGQKVIVLGSVSIYERDGRYQLYAKEILLEGSGLLYQKMEELKKKLEEMGMFSQEYKQPIPRYIEKLGIVTASTGAAVRDIINIAKRRNPYLQIILYPALVQGEGAAESIVKGIETLDRYGVDTIIIGRGGGSIEDLWAFNEEIVARAVFQCSTPIISAVGHETDTTISDYVADLRAPTPSAAAELAVFDYGALQEKLWDYQRRMGSLLKNKLIYIRSIAENYSLKLNYLSPVSQIREKRQYAADLENRLQENMKKLILNKRYQLDIYIEKMNGLSPLQKLNQGYSFVADERGMAVTDVEQVKKDDLLRIHVANGEISAKVLDKVKMRRNHNG